MPVLHYIQPSAIAHSAALLFTFTSELAGAYCCAKHLGHDSTAQKQVLVPLKCPSVSETSPVGCQTGCTLLFMSLPPLPKQCPAASGRHTQTEHYPKQSQTPKAEALHQILHICGVNLLSPYGIGHYSDPLITELWLQGRKEVWVWCPGGMPWLLTHGGAREVWSQSKGWLVFIPTTRHLWACPE